MPEQEPKQDVYAALIKAGIETDSHESDLYARDSVEARRVVHDCGYPVVLFSSSDGSMWLDLPFAYTPFWTAKAR